MATSCSPTQSDARPHHEKDSSSTTTTTIDFRLLNLISTMYQTPLSSPTSVRSLVAALENQNTSKEEESIRSSPLSSQNIHRRRPKPSTHRSSFPLPSRPILKQESFASLVSTLSIKSETSRTRFSENVDVITVSKFRDYADQFYDDEEIADFKYNKMLWEAGVLEEG